MLFYIIKVSLISSVLLKTVDSTCIVAKYDDSRQKQPCIFPFTFTNDGKEETHKVCTDRLDPNGRYWCSIKVCMYALFINFFYILIPFTLMHI